MQNPTEYAPLLFKLAQDEAQRQATVGTVENAVRAGLAPSDVLDSLIRQMNADRAGAFRALMKSLVAGSGAGAGQVPVSITIDVYSDEAGSVISTPLVQTYHPVVDPAPAVEGLAIAAPDGVYDEATLRIHATVAEDYTDFEGSTAIYAAGEVEVRDGRIDRWTQEEFNCGIEGYARPVLLAEWAEKATKRLFPVT